MPRHALALIPALLAVALAGCEGASPWRVHSPDDVRPSQPVASGDADDGAPAAPDASTTRPARRMLLDRPPVPVTEPTVARRRPDRPEPPAREGTMVVDRLARLEYHPETGWYLTRFADEPDRPDQPPRWVLPCRLLQRMERIHADTPDAWFRVSGETTTQDAKAYVLPRKVIVVARRSGEPAPNRSPAVTPDTRPADDEDESGPDRPTPKPGSAADVAERLLSQRPGRPVLTPVEDPTPSADEGESVAPPAQGRTLPPGRGRMVVDRLVRIEPGSAKKWMRAVFEADNTLREPPMRMLPCRLLDDAERLARSARLAGGLRLRVSGEMTFYKGRRYLLLRKMMREREMDQF